MLGELVDRITPVLQDAGLAVQVGDGATARGRIHERGVIRHDPEVLFIDLDVAQRGRADRAVLDRDLIRLAGAIVRDRQRVSSGGHATAVLGLLLWRGGISLLPPLWREVSSTRRYPVMTAVNIVPATSSTVSNVRPRWT